MSKNKCTEYVIGSVPAGNAVERADYLALGQALLGSADSDIKHFRSWKSAQKQIERVQAAGNDAVIVSVRVRGVDESGSEPGATAV